MCHHTSLEKVFAMIIWLADTTSRYESVIIDVSLHLQEFPSPASKKKSSFGLLSFVHIFYNFSSIHQAGYSINQIPDMATNRGVASSSEESVVLQTYTEGSSCSDEILSTTTTMSHSSLEIFKSENEREYNGSKNVTKAIFTDHETTHESNLLDEVASGDRPMESVVATLGRSLPAQDMSHERINQEE